MSEHPGAGEVPVDTEQMVGTVKFYQRHVFVCTGNTGWPAHIDTDGGFCQALAEAIAAAGPALPRVVKLNACDEPSRDSGYDLLVFPDLIRYVGLEIGDLAAFVEDHLAGNRASGRLAHEPITGRHAFVCVHAARDPRCGGCGPAVADRLSEELAGRGLSGDVHVHRTSHVGGHQYAGNLLIYPGGDWYGHVTPEDVPVIVAQHLLAGQRVPALWRGRMGLTSVEQVASLG